MAMPKTDKNSLAKSHGAAKQTVRRNAALKSQHSVSAKTSQRNTSKQESVDSKIVAGPRRLQLPKKHWYKAATWRRNLPAPTRKPVGKSRLLIVRITKQVFGNWKLFGGIVLIYGIFNLLLVRGLSGSANLTNVKSSIDQAFTGSARGIESSATSFLVLLTSSGSGNTAAAGPYQFILLVVCGLAIVWALRQTTAKHVIRIRDSFYEGMRPLVQSILVVFVIALQLLPLVIGTTIYNLVLSAQIATNGTEKIVLGIVCLLPVILSIRMIVASIFALYIVTLPGMTPLRALRTSSELVYKRRLLVLRKLVLLPISMLVIAAIIELPLIAWLTPAAEWVFFGLSMVALVYVHAYLYGLYRELI
jgi:hypothetical protein